MLGRESEFRFRFTRLGGSGDNPTGINPLRSICHCLDSQKLSNMLRGGELPRQVSTVTKVGGAIWFEFKYPVCVGYKQKVAQAVNDTR